MTVTLTDGDRDAFFDAPFDAYGPEVGYVSPLQSDVMRMLDPAKNPLWTAGNPFRFWTAHRDGRPVGRIIAHVHGQSNERHGWQARAIRLLRLRRRSRGGRGSCSTLRNAFAREDGQDELVGNFNLTAMQQCGVMTGGFGAPAPTPTWSSIRRHLPRPARSERLRRPSSRCDVRDRPCSGRPRPIRHSAQADGFRFAPIEKRPFPERMEEARRC